MTNPSTSSDQAAQVPLSGDWAPSGSWRAPAVGAVLIFGMLLWAALRQMNAAGLQIEVIGLGAICAPLLLAPALVRWGLVRRPGPVPYLLALAAWPALGAHEVASWGAYLALASLWWPLHAKTRSDGSPGSRAASLGLLGIGGAAVFAVLAQDSKFALLRLLLVTLIAWEALNQDRDRSSTSDSRRALAGWILAASSIAPLVRGAGHLDHALAGLTIVAFSAIRANKSRQIGSLSVLYGACMFASLSVFAQLGGHMEPPAKLHPDMSLTLGHRLSYYEAHKEEFDLVFLGDSRTLCGVHPSRLDPLLGTSSLNLSIWANWLPTQYPFFKDLVDRLRPGTTIVFSLGPVNFRETGLPAFATTYPIPLSDLGLYLSLGFSFSQLRANLIEYSLLGKPLRPILYATTKFRQTADSFASRTLYSSAVGEAQPDLFAAEAEELKLELGRDPANIVVRSFLHEGRTTSVEAYSQDGAYLRYELDRASFRERQDTTTKSVAGANVPEEFEPESGRMALFKRILSLCASRGVRLIVNAIEQAPHTYTPEQKAMERRFMLQVVKPLVEAHGFVYTHADYDKLRDEDYFDYNHLNAVGVERYSPLLAEVLRPHVGSKRD